MFAVVSSVSVRQIFGLEKTEGRGMTVRDLERDKFFVISIQ